MSWSTRCTRPTCPTGHRSPLCVAPFLDTLHGSTTNGRKEKKRADDLFIQLSPQATQIHLQQRLPVLNPCLEELPKKDLNSLEN